MNTNILDTIEMRELGKELQQARVKQGLTQEDAARIINVARTTITAIEKGKRRIKADELIKLAQAYNRQISDFVRSHPKIEPILAQFRSLSLGSEEDRTTLTASIDDLEKLCRDYLELEQITHSPLIRKYPLEYEITGLPTAQAAESITIEERYRLGLGDGPILPLREILEQDVGLRIFYLPLRPLKASAIYFFADPLGGCIAINNQHAEEHRRLSLAHSYAYFLVHRHQPTVFVEEGYQRLPEIERFAKSFVRSFLMPTSGLLRHFNDIHRTKGKITLADLCTLAHYYGVPIAEITLRLEDMKLLPNGIWEKLQAGGLKVPEAPQLLDPKTLSANNEQLPLRYQYLAIDAFDRALITEGRFASFLRVDRLEARHIAELLRPYTQDATDGTIIDADMTQLLSA
jgi:Zn-dependent peptidase ImmA (M78 family)/DNA-binding XRE family transcriptional regulator